MTKAAGFALVLSLVVHMALPGAGAQSFIDDQVHVVLPRDAIMAIWNPQFDAMDRAERYMRDEEPVLGLVGDKEQRAYPTWLLDRHEIVNDVFDGFAVAITWCPLCGTGVVYDRAVNQLVLSFGVSGMLYRDGLVMYDRETNTLWTQVDGQARGGSLNGQTLQIVPSVHATWKEWKTLYPTSVVLRKQGEVRTPYETYYRDSGRFGITGRRLRDNRLPGKARVIGVRTADTAMAFAEDDVRAAKLIETDVGSLPIVLTAPTDEHPILVYDRRVQGRVLSFELELDSPHLVDLETRSRWSMARGDAIAGPLRGAQLQRAPANPAFWFGWQSYFPETDVWGHSR